MNNAELEPGQVWTDPADGHKRKWKLVKVVNGIAQFDGSYPGSSIQTLQTIRVSQMIGWELQQDASHEQR